MIGVDPGRLAPGTPVDRLSPSTLARAIVQGQQQSPSVLAAMYGVDIAALSVKISEGALYPNLGVIGVLQGNHAEAVTQFRRALVMQPDNASARLLLGSSLLELRKNAEAVRELKRAAVLLPDEPQVHLQLGTAYEALANWIAAVQEFITGRILPPGASVMLKRSGFMSTNFGSGCGPAQMKPMMRWPGSARAV